MTDPFTPTEQPDEVLPVEEEPADEAEVGAWMGEKDEEPSETPDPEW